MSSNSIPRCIITGCAFVDSEGLMAAWGDLWEVGDCYVFNATTNYQHNPGETFWQFSLPPDEIKQVITHRSPQQPYFERRAVLVIDKAACYLNQAAKDYLK